MTPNKLPKFPTGKRNLQWQLHNTAQLQYFGIHLNFPATAKREKEKDNIGENSVTGFCILPLHTWSLQRYKEDLPWKFWKFQYALGQDCTTYFNPRPHLTLSDMQRIAIQVSLDVQLVTEWLFEVMTDLPWAYLQHGDSKFQWSALELQVLDNMATFMAICNTPWSHNYVLWWFC